jgi:hypothetical protein
MGKSLAEYKDALTTQPYVIFSDLRFACLLVERRPFPHFDTVERSARQKRARS